MLDHIGAGLVFAVVCFAVAVFVGIGFAVAICRGSRLDRRSRTG